MPARRVLLGLAVLGVLLSACSSSGSARSPQETLPPTTTVAPTTTTEAPPVTAADVVAADVAMAEVGGLIAVAGPSGLRVLRPTGETVARFGVDSIVAQPTWSRDATRLVATFFNQTTGATEIGIIDTATWELTLQQAFRPYFFYTWNESANLIAALGPGTTGGTSVDILDATGSPASNTPVAGGSMYVAWEPGSDDLLLHANDQLLLIDDLTAVEDSAEIAMPGTNFQAASWIPGTRDYLYVDSTDGDGRLIRRSADGGDPIDLGAAPGFTFISVHPDGSRAALGTSAGGGDPNIVQASFAQADAGSVVEIVDLETGERTPVLESIGFWLEWSPDGQHLLIATTDGTEFTWKIWDDAGLTDMGAFVTTPDFFQNYIPFANQFTETPRLWSPDSSAFTFGAVLNGVTSAVAVRISDGSISRVGIGDVAFWSPVPVPGQ